MAKMKTLTVNGRVYTVEDADSISFGEAQKLTPDQQKTARQNIGAAEDASVVKQVNGYSPDDIGNVRINDDTKVGADTWSSKNTVDKLCPAFTASGSVVVCNPVEGYPLEVVWCGKNLWRYEDMANGGGNDVVFEKTNTGLVLTAKNSGIWQWRKFKWLPISALDGKTITLSAKITATGTASPFLGIGYLAEDNSGKVAGEIVKSGSVSITVDSASANAQGCKYIGLWVYINASDNPCTAGDTAEYSNIQIEIGNTATAYEPYSGGTFARGDRINALPGMNTLYSDSGNIAISGRSHPVPIINNLLTRLAALEAAVVNNA